MATRVTNLTRRIGARRNASLVMVLGGLLLSVSPAVAQPAWTGLLTQVGTGVVRESKVAGDAAGNAIAIWLEGASQISSTVYVARFNAQSRTWAAPTALDTGRSEVDIAMTGAGNAIATWVAPAGQLRAARFVAASATWGTPATPSGSQTASFYRTAIDPQGNAVTVWEGFASNTRLLMASRFSAAAGAWGAPETVATLGTGSGASAQARVVMDSLGTTSVVFGTGTGATRSLVMSRSNAGSSSWSSPQLVVQDNVGNTELAVDGAGNILAVWGSATSRVRATRYLASSGAWSPPQDLGPTGLSPLIKADAAGNAVVVWIRIEPQQAVVYSGVFLASTGAWTAAPNLPTASSPSLLPGLAVDGTGMFTAVWAAGGTVYAARRVASQPWTTPTPLFEGSGVLQPSATGSAAGEVTVLAGLRSTRWSLQGAEALAAPTGLTITTFLTPNDEALIDEPLTVSWLPRTTGLPITGYQIEAGTSTGATDLASLRLGPVTQVAATVPVIRRIFLRVRAVNGNVVGPPSTERVLVVAGVCEGQPAPRDLTATVAGTLVTLRWPTTHLSTGYLVEAGSGSGSSNIASIPVSTSANRGLTAAALPGTYYIRVRSVGPCGTSNPSNEVVATVGGAPGGLPGVPTLNAPVVTGNTVSLSWSAGSGPAPTGFILTGSLTPTGPPIATVPVGGTSVSFSGAPSGTFYLRLSATNAAGSSPPSAPVTLVVP